MPAGADIPLAGEAAHVRAGTASRTASISAIPSRPPRLRGCPRSKRLKEIPGGRLCTPALFRSCGDNPARLRVGRRWPLSGLRNGVRFSERIGSRRDERHKQCGRRVVDHLDAHLGELQFPPLPSISDRSKAACGDAGCGFAHQKIGDRQKGRAPIGVTQRKRQLSGMVDRGGGGVPLAVGHGNRPIFATRRCDKVSDSPS